MMAFKGVSADLTARYGKGRVQFTPGETQKAEKSMTAKCGFHCCENPLDCLRYYNLDHDKFFLVEAAGSIDEDDDHKIACTEITLIKELTLKEIAGYAVLYMLRHPLREGWQRVNSMWATAEQDKAGSYAGNQIVIARGPRPLAMAGEGAVIGLLLEPRKGEITAARVFTVSRQQAGKWYTLSHGGKIEEVTDAV